MKRFLIIVLVSIVAACAGYFSTKMDRVVRIAWSSSALRDLDSMWVWSGEEKNELAVCLYGRMNLNSSAIYVTRTESPYKENLLTYNSATIQCRNYDGDFLGIAHTHPSGYAYMSGTDETTLNTLGFSLMTVVCGSTCRTTYKAGSSHPLETIR